MNDLFFLNRKDIELSAGDDLVLFVKFELINDIPSADFTFKIRKEMYSNPDRTITPAVSAEGTSVKIIIKSGVLNLKKGVYFYNLTSKIKDLVLTPAKGRVIIR